MATHTVFIHQWRPTALNSLFRAHWAQKNKLKKNDALNIFAATNGIPKATGKRRVSLHIILTGQQKEADPDAYWKSLNDGLVKCGMLIDDKGEFCELGTVTYGRGRKVDSGTQIILTDIN